MNIIDKIDAILNESGIKNMRKIAKQYKEAEIYFHMDLDGVASALGMKSYLAGYGIKTVDAHPINYGSKEYAVPSPKKGTLHVLVDFAHGKPVMHIHTDHHDNQVGWDDTQSVAFVHEPSNASYISQKLSTRDLFPNDDIRMISTIDSADFAKYNIEPEDVMNSIYKTDPKLPVSKNKEMQALVTNKLILAYKNKKGFLKKLVLDSNPSLISLYNNTIKLAKKEGYKTPEDVSSGLKDYVKKQGAKRKPELTDPQRLKNGESTMWGNTLVQYGGGSMFNGYDRYTPFKLNPDAHYFVMGWPMGLIQVSKNPFKKAKNPYHLGKLIFDGIFKKRYKKELQKIEVSLAKIKRIFEEDANPESLGFTFNDVLALFDPKQVRGVKIDGENLRWTDIVKDITNKKYAKLSFKQKKILNNVTITCWDIVNANSGGHPDITNISGLNFIGKGYPDVMKKMMKTIAIEMKDKGLKI